MTLMDDSATMMVDADASCESSSSNSRGAALGCVRRKRALSGSTYDPTPHTSQTHHHGAATGRRKRALIHFAAPTAPHHPNPHYAQGLPAFPMVPTTAMLMTSTATATPPAAVLPRSKHYEDLTSIASTTFPPSPTTHAPHGALMLFDDYDEDQDDVVWEPMAHFGGGGGAWGSMEERASVAPWF